MSLDEAIHNYLCTIPELLAIVEKNSIQWIDAEQGTVYPRIVYQLISSPLDYDSVEQWQRWQFTIIHQDKWKCDEIAGILTKHLHGFRGSDKGTFGGLNIDYIARLANIGSNMREDNQYQKIQDYSIYFH